MADSAQTLPKLFGWLLRFLSLVTLPGLVHFRRSLAKIGFTDYVVPIEYAAGPVPRDRHRYGLRDAAPYHLPYCTASEVVEDQS